MHSVSILTAYLVCAQEWMSAFFSFILYVAVLLRVRGNLIQDPTGKWSLRWVSCSESWQLAFARDYLDSCTVKMAAIIVWYAPIRVPTIAARLHERAASRYPVRVYCHRIGTRQKSVFDPRLVGLGDIHRAHRPNVDRALRKLRRCPGPSRVHLSGRLCIRARRCGLSPPTCAPCATSDHGFAVIGFANLMLFLGTRRLIPDVATIPDLSTPRSRLDKRSPQAAGITPFVLTSRDAEEGPSVMATASDGQVAVSWSERRLSAEMGEPKSRASSVLSVLSHASTQPLNPPR